MQFLENIFKKKPKVTYSQLVLNTSLQLFELYGIDKPTDLQMFKSFTFLCACGKIYLKLKDKDSEFKIKELIRQCDESMSILNVTIDELIDTNYFSMAKELVEKYGTSVFKAIMFDLTFESPPPPPNSRRKGARNLEKFLIEKMNGPFGFPAIAGIVVIDGILGQDKSKEFFPDVVLEMRNFISTLLEI